MPLSIVETALAERTLALVDLPSPSHEEGLVYDYVRGTLHHLPLAHDDGETLFYAAPAIDEAALVVCLEPTDNTLQLGCLGNLVARVVFEGRAAHSARPWLGVNAIALALEGLRGVLELEPHDVDVDGLVFREVLSVTQIHG